MDCKVWIEDHRGWIALLHIEDDPKPEGKYRKISNISRTESPNLNVPRLVLQLSLPNPMKPGVTSRMKM